MAMNDHLGPLNQSERKFLKMADALWNDVCGQIAMRDAVAN